MTDTDRDAAPAAPSAAAAFFDRGLYDGCSDAIHAHGQRYPKSHAGRCNLGCFQDGFAAGVDWAARPAPLAAPREGGEDAALLLELAHLAAEQFAALVIRDFGGVGLMIPPRLADALLAIAAREAARGDVPSGTYHHPVVDAAGHELVGDGTP